ncbi:MAG TPA: hypothetical protein VEY10_01040, partial [Flavisolibacter sp.]|nr:hypothetical protein [Flavisolibacter sp.]
LFDVVICFFILFDLKFLALSQTIVRASNDSKSDLGYGALRLQEQNYLCFLLCNTKALLKTLTTKHLIIVVKPMRAKL